MVGVWNNTYYLAKKKVNTYSVILFMNELCGMQMQEIGDGHALESVRSAFTRPVYDSKLNPARECPQLACKLCMHARMRRLSTHTSSLARI